MAKHSSAWDLFFRALAKSVEQVKANNFPVYQEREDRAHYTEERWTVTSRTQRREPYIVRLITTDQGDISLRCSCEAAQYCWHRMHVARAHLNLIFRDKAPAEEIKKLANIVMPAIFADDGTPYEELMSGRIARTVVEQPGGQQAH